MDLDSDLYLCFSLQLVHAPWASHVGECNRHVCEPLPPALPISPPPPLPVATVLRIREQVVVVVRSLLQRGGVDELDDAPLPHGDGRHSVHHGLRAHHDDAVRFGPSAPPLTVGVLPRRKVSDLRCRVYGLRFGI